jgi:hypothetical protein
MWIEHKMRWFVVGPGGVGMDNGIEFTVVLVVCSVACILGYWPQGDRRGRASASRRAATTGGGATDNPY